MSKVQVADQTKPKTVPTVVGKVKSAKMDKTIVVEIETKVRHPKYQKYIKHVTSRFAHDENNQCKPGDKVRIQECRPISRHKAWTLVEVIESASSEQ